MLSSCLNIQKLTFLQNDLVIKGWVIIFWILDLGFWILIPHLFNSVSSIKNLVLPKGILFIIGTTQLFL